MKDWTTFLDENGKELFLNLETGEVDEGFTVQLHLRTGSKYKVISPERQAYLKRKREKHLKKLILKTSIQPTRQNWQDYFCRMVLNLSEFIMIHGAIKESIFSEIQRNCKGL